MQSEPLIHEVVARSTGVSYPAISPTDLTRIRIPVPTLSQQEAVANFLDRETAEADALIAKYERLADLIRERRSALITAAVTGQIDVTTYKPGINMEVA